MRSFHVADLNAKGELQVSAQYFYEDLASIPFAAEIIGTFSGFLYQNPLELHANLPQSLSLRMTSPSPTSAIGTLREDDKLLSLSLLLTGISADADRVTLGVLQTHLLRELHDTPFEAGFSLLQLEARPMVASIHLAMPQNPDAKIVFAVADRCLGAAYFRYHHLV